MSYFLVFFYLFEARSHRSEKRLLHSFIRVSLYVSARLSLDGFP